MNLRDTTALAVACTYIVGYAAGASSSIVVIVASTGIAGLCCYSILRSFARSIVMLHDTLLRLADKQERKS